MCVARLHGQCAFHDGKHDVSRCVAVGGEDVAVHAGLRERHDSQHLGALRTKTVKICGADATAILVPTQ